MRTASLAFSNLVSEELWRNKRRGFIDRNLVEAPSIVIAACYKADLLFWFFSGLRCGVRLFPFAQHSCGGVIGSFLYVCRYVRTYACTLFTFVIALATSLIIQFDKPVEELSFILSRGQN